MDKLIHLQQMYYIKHQAMKAGVTVILQTYHPALTMVLLRQQCFPIVAASANIASWSKHRIQRGGMRPFSHLSAVNHDRA